MKTIFSSTAIAMLMGCSIAAQPLHEQIIASVSYLGRSPTEIGVTFDGTTDEEDGAVGYEKSFDVEGDKVWLGVTAVDGTVVQINWLASPNNVSGRFEDAYRQINSLLVRQGFTLLSQSIAIDGRVVLGNEFKHSDPGASFWTSLVNPGLRVRVDMSYILCRPKSSKFSIGIFSGQPDLAVSNCGFCVPHEGGDHFETERDGRNSTKKKAEPGATDNPGDAH